MLFSNDISPFKAEAYAAAFGPETLRIGDVNALCAADLPGQATLAWASFPCQDLSLAGARAGLAGARSSTFWGFWGVMRQLESQGRRPPLLVLENVRGLLTSKGGEDFAKLVAVLGEAGFHVGAAEIDARHFTPQSRPRLFIVAARWAPIELTSPGPTGDYHSGTMVNRVAALPPEAAARWRWWRLPPPPRSNMTLADIVEQDSGCPKTGSRLLGLMSNAHRAAAEKRRLGPTLQVGAAFRRVRTENGARVQRAEIRFDGLAGCLRTPAGGSSRQFVVFAGKGRFEARLLTARECARLMGAPDDFPLPASETRALHMLGDGVSVPAVRWLSQHLLQPLACAQWASRFAA